MKDKSLLVAVSGNISKICESFSINWDLGTCLHKVNYKINKNIEFTK